MRDYPDLLQAAGVLGSIIYVGGFALVQCGWACGNGTGYSVSKILAAVLVLISLIGAFNLGSFLIQVGFIIFGCMGLVCRGVERSQKAMRRRAFPITERFGKRHVAFRTNTKAPKTVLAPLEG
ncbi:CBU_0592 family membrane protein [Aliiroseovarius sp. CAU 1755]